MTRPFCEATKDSFICNLDFGHTDDHRHLHPSGGCVGWSNVPPSHDDLENNELPGVPVAAREQAKEIAADLEDAGLVEPGLCGIKAMEIVIRHLSSPTDPEEAYDQFTTLAQLRPGSGALREALERGIEQGITDARALRGEAGAVLNAAHILKVNILSRVEAALSLSSPIESAAPTQCDKQTHMYVWTVSPRWVAVAQAQNVADAREVLLEEIGTSKDGSCPEREAADKWVREKNPSIWHARNAEFALTDSAELREQEAFVETLQKKIEALACPTAQASSEVREVREAWRVGKTVPINVYEGDRPVCQCHTVADAKRIVQAVNAPSRQGAGR